MLPNHAPLVVAEQFGTLATLYPDRIELGLGRAQVQIRSPCVPYAADIRKQKISSREML